MHNGVCFSDARRAEEVLGSIFVSCRDHPWIPCAAARTGINTVTPQRRRAFLKGKFGAEERINQRISDKGLNFSELSRRY